MQSVYPAESYRFGAMSSLGNASYMLIRQHDFPAAYNPEMDTMIGWDHDRIMSHDYEHARRCFDQHLKTGELSLESWALQASPAEIIAFLQDILKADTKVAWTGFRILGTVNRSNGFPVWTFQLFAKHPESEKQPPAEAISPPLSTISGERVVIWSL